MPCCRRWAARPALNLAMDLHRMGVIGVPGTPEMLGADATAIATAEDRGQFKAAMVGIGLDVPASGIAHSLDEAVEIVGAIGLPVIIRPAYILGGRGTGIASNVGGVPPAGRRRDWRRARSAKSSSRSRSPAGRSSSSR